MSSNEYVFIFFLIRLLKIKNTTKIQDSIYIIDVYTAHKNTLKYIIIISIITIITHTSRRRSVYALY